MSGLAVQHELVSALAALEAADILHPCELALPPDMPFATYERVGVALGAISRAQKWWIGDFILYGEATYGEAYAQAVEATGLNKETIRNYVWVCGRVPPSRRVEGLGITIHAAVAALKPRDQRRWLAAAKREGLSLRDLRDRIREEADLLSAADPPENEEPAAASRGGERESGAPLVEPLPGPIGGTTVSGLPNAYVVAGPVVRRIAQESLAGRDGYMRVPRDLFDRLIAVLDNDEGDD